MCVRGWETDKSSHFVEETSHGPDVAFFVVRELIDLLRGHVVGSAHISLGELRISAQNTRQPKVPQLELLVAVDEHVGRLDVSAAVARARPRSILPNRTTCRQISHPRPQQGDTAAASG